MRRGSVGGRHRDVNQPQKDSKLGAVVNRVVQDHAPQDRGAGHGEDVSCTHEEGPRLHEMFLSREHAPLVERSADRVVNTMPVSVPPGCRAEPKDLEKVAQLFRGGVQQVHVMLRALSLRLPGGWAERPRAGRQAQIGSLRGARDNPGVVREPRAEAVAGKKCGGAPG